MAESERPTSTTSTVTETRPGGNGFLYFAVGALIVAVGVLGWMFYDGSWRQDRSADTAVERTANAIGNAAEDISDATRNAARNIPAPAPAPAPAQPAPVAPPAQPATPG
jgi:hypothetical protein